MSLLHLIPWAKIALNSIWCLGLLAGLLNISLLFYPLDKTIYYLRLYQTGLSLYYAWCLALMWRFLYKNRNEQREKEKRDLPRPLVVAASLLTVATVLGFGLWTLVTLAFHDCDVVLRSHHWPALEAHLDRFNNVLLMLFVASALYYVLQRKRSASSLWRRRRRRKKR